MSPAKIGMYLTWVFLIAAQFVPALSNFRNPAFLALIILPIVHTLEFFFYIPLIKKIPGSMGTHFVQVLFHGLIHFIDMRKTLKAQAAA